MKKLLICTILALLHPNLCRAETNPPISVAPTNYNSGSSTVASAVIATGKPILLYSIDGYCGTAQFFQLYDNATVPSDGAPPSPTPVYSIKVAIGNFSIDFGTKGKTFKNGLVWATSSAAAPFNKTAGSTDCFVSARYGQ